MIARHRAPTAMNSNPLQELKRKPVHIMRQPEFCLLYRIRDRRGVGRVWWSEIRGVARGTELTLSSGIELHSRSAVERQKVLYWLLFAFGFSGDPRGAPITRTEGSI